MDAAVLDVVCASGPRFYLTAKCTEPYTRPHVSRPPASCAVDERPARHTRKVPNVNRTKTTMTPPKMSVAALALSALIALASGASAAVVTITDCLADPHLDVFSSTTRIDVGADDLVIQCALAPIGNTEHITLLGNRITVQGPSG